MQVAPTTTTTPTVALNMIVKNESKIIHRLLESVLPFIDTYVIMDTGSTDDTIAKIEDFFTRHPMPIEGRIVFEPFRDFATTRTSALRHCAGISDYILFMDADMVLQIHNPDLVINKGALLRSPTPLALTIVQGDEGFYYNNMRIISNVAADILEGRCRYWGYTHEYLSLPPNYRQGGINKTDLFIHDIGDGGAKADKYERDTRLLLRGIEDDSAHMRPRYYFYLANTYYNYGKTLTAGAQKETAFNQSIKYYNLRIAAGGWEQEVWYSYYNRGLCEMELGQPERAVYTWMLAYDYYPHRIENLYEIVKHYTNIYKQKTADVYYRIADAILTGSPVLKAQKDQMLFLHNSVYTYQLLFQYSIYAPYLGIKNMNAEVVQLLCAADVPICCAVLSNMKFYDTALAAPRVRVVLADLDYTDAEKGYNFVSSSSCMIPATATTYALNVRMVNYRIRPNDGGYILAADQKIVSENLFMTLDQSFNRVSETAPIQMEMDYDEATNATPSQYAGIEDVRIFSMMTTETPQFFMGTTWHKSTQKLGMVFGEYDAVGQTCLARELHAPFALSAACEKNWVFVNYQDDLCIIYKWGPALTVCDLLEKDDTSAMIIQVRETRQMPAIFNQVRGSTSGVNVSSTGEIWFICHLVDCNNTPRRYYHMFVVLNADDLHLKRYSAPFTFEKEPIEYCLSLIVEADRVIVNYSTWDSKTIIAAYDREYVEQLLSYK